MIIILIVNPLYTPSLSVSTESQWTGKQWCCLWANSFRKSQLDDGQDIISGELIWIAFDDNIDIFLIFVCLFSLMFCINLFCSSRKSCINLETSIVPMATLEVGLIEMEQGNYELALKWLDSAEKDFGGYTAENFVHLKAYAAIRRMGHKTDKQKEDKEKCMCIHVSCLMIVTWWWWWWWCQHAWLFL